MNKPRGMDRRYESINMGDGMGDRPLTFGLIKRTEPPLKSSVEYKEDRILKNQVLEEISQIRRSQESLALSKEHSASCLRSKAGDEAAHIYRCSNHNNKKVTVN